MPAPQFGIIMVLTILFKTIRNNSLRYQKAIEGCLRYWITIEKLHFCLKILHVLFKYCTDPFICLVFVGCICNIIWDILFIIQGSIILYSDGKNWKLRCIKCLSAAFCSNILLLGKPQKWRTVTNFTINHRRLRLVVEGLGQRLFYERVIGIGWVRVSVETMIA